MSEIEIETPEELSWAPSPEVWEPRSPDWEPRTGHDWSCEWGRMARLDFGGLGYRNYVSNECQCAVRAYQRDPYPGALREPWSDAVMSPDEEWGDI